ncbi:MAG: uridine kinase [Okeania sp. SIO3I5]|uniref:uridine kinase n=1 Tax=Okeania sp. SIO3I5 TaxID=2607805 RepID=UPI0013B67936|nr:uridine kinase [Okeania sp. SIO3I5]NEQ36213.1 uridine kinase [Okeania sp. SIO3I5]
MANEVFNLLQAKSLKVALVSLDAWHNSQDIRFNEINSAQHFYENAFRWEELFNSLIIPLKSQKSIRLEAELIDIKTDNFYSYIYDFQNIDIIIIEGIFLFKEPFIKEYDFKLWLNCSFETTLKRALSRRQEGLTKEQTIYDYQTTYFPAQTIHFKQDNPQKVASLVIDNDLPTKNYDIPLGVHTL